MCRVVGSRCRLEELGEVLQDLLSRGGSRAGQLVAQELLGRGEEGQRSNMGWERSSLVGLRSSLVGWRSSIGDVSGLRSTVECGWRHLGVN